MRCPTQAAPMPPAQAEALYDLGLEERHQDTAEAEALSSANNRYDDSLMRRAESSIATRSAHRGNSRVSSLQSASPEKGSTPAAQASLYPSS